MRRRLLILAMVVALAAIVVFAVGGTVLATRGNHCGSGSSACAPGQEMQCGNRGGAQMECRSGGAGCMNGETRECPGQSENCTQQMRCRTD